MCLIQGRPALQFGSSDRRHKGASDYKGAKVAIARQSLVRAISPPLAPLAAPARGEAGSRGVGVSGGERDGVGSARRVVQAQQAPCHDSGKVAVAACGDDRNGGAVVKNRLAWDDT